MFRIKEDPSSGSLVQRLAKNYNNDSIVSVDMDKLSVMEAYCDPLCVCVRVGQCLRVPSLTVNYKHSQPVTICCHNTDHIHVNGHDRIMLVIFSQALYKAP